MEVFAESAYQMMVQAQVHSEGAHLKDSEEPRHEEPTGFNVAIYTYIKEVQEGQDEGCGSLWHKTGLAGLD